MKQAQMSRDIKVHRTKVWEATEKEKGKPC